MKKIIFVFILIIIIFAVFYIISNISEKKLKRELADNMIENTKIDLIVVEKAKRTLSIYDNGTLVKSYKISLGKNPVGHKQFEGDSKTPEGIYYIDGKNPKSKPLFNIYGDWTEGCIAVNNEDMAELYNIIDIGTKIEIKQ